MLKDENEWIHGYWESRCEFCNVKSKIDGFSHLVYFIGNNCLPINIFICFICL